MAKTTKGKVSNPFTNIHIEFQQFYHPSYFERKQKWI